MLLSHSVFCAGERLGECLLRITNKVPSTRSARQSTLTAKIREIYRIKVINLGSIKLSPHA